MRHLEILRPTQFNVETILLLRTDPLRGEVGFQQLETYRKQNNTEYILEDIIEKGELPVILTECDCFKEFEPRYTHPTYQTISN